MRAHINARGSCAAKTQLIDNGSFWLAVGVFGLVTLAATLGALMWRRRQALKGDLPHQRLVELAPEAMMIAWAGHFVYANPAAAALLGARSPRELIGKRPFDVLHPDCWDSARARMEQLYAGKSLPSVEQRYRRLDGSTVDVEVLSVPLRFFGKSSIQIYAREITERKTAERRATRLSSLYAALALIDQTLVRARDSDELLNDACRIAVEYGKLQTTWVGMVESDGQQIRPVAASGPGAAYAREVFITLDGARPEGQGPFATAIREARPYVCNDFEVDPKTLPWREQVAKYGFRSIAVFPLRTQGRPIGAIAHYAAETGFFEPDLVDLLDRMADDISFALDRLDGERLRVTAETALAQQQRMLAALMSNLPGMVYRCRDDDEWTMDFVSEGCFEVTGYRPEDLIGNRLVSFNAIIHPDDRARVFGEVRGAFPSNGRFSIEYRILHRSGEERWVYERGIALRSDSGEIEALEGFITDITERRRAEQSLRESEVRFRSLTALSADWYWEQDEQHRFTKISGELAASGAGRQDDYLGLCRWEVPGCRSPEGGWDAHRALLAQRATLRDVRYSRKLADGSVRWFRFSGEPVFDENNRFRGYRGVGREITLQRRAEEDLVRFRAAMEIAADAIFLIDFDTLNYVDVNSTASILLGYTREELLALSPRTVNVGFDEANFRARYQRVRELGDAGQTLDPATYWVRRKDGTTVPVEVYRRYVEFDDSRVVVAVARDISARRRAEDTLVLFRAAMETTADAIFLTDFDTLGYIDVNETACRMLGYSREELLQLHVPDVVNPGTTESEIRQRFAATRERGAAGLIEREDRFLHAKDGKVFPIEVYRRWFEVGEKQLIISVARDISERKRAEEALLRFRTAIDMARDAIFLIDRQTMRYMDVNDTACRLFGYSREEMLQMGPAELNLGLSREELEQKLDETIALAGSSSQPESEGRFNRRRDGSTFPVEVYRVAIRVGDRDIIVAFTRDISERLQSEEALHLRNRAIEASTNAIIITSNLVPDHPIISVNSAFESITGYGAAEAVGRNCRFLQGEDRDQPGLNELRAALQENHDARAVLRNYRKDGGLFWSQLTISPVRDASGRVTHHLGIAQDITESVQYREQLEHQANHDALTGLPNRNLLRDRLAQGIAYAQRHGCVLATVFFDLDNFKLINDTLGHRAGDALLQEMSNRLRNCVREDDTIARLGGDEFVALLNDQPSKASVTQAIYRLVKALSQPMNLEQHEITSTCSIGISLYPSDGADGETLLKHADAAMYRAKAAGRNTFQFFSAEMNEELSQRLQLEAQLRRALERDEFRLHYQTRIGLESGRVEGVEALIRWQSQEFGLVSPARFIPVAEDTGLIVPIGDWVMRVACRQMRDWHDRGLPQISVSVNISPRQFKRRELVSEIAQVLELTGLDSRFLEIEVTESLVMENAEEFVANLRALKNLGIEISVDDFGTGYSSLNYLKRFPVDRLKVDQSFVRDIGRNADDAAIVQAIVQLGHSLGLQVTAEGVETEEQLAFLRRCGCDQAQGYLFSKPLPADAVEALLRQQS